MGTVALPLLVSACVAALVEGREIDDFVTFLTSRRACRLRVRTPSATIDSVDVSSSLISHAFGTVVGRLWTDGLRRHQVSDYAPQSLIHSIYWKGRGGYTSGRERKFQNGSSLRV